MLGSLSSADYFEEEYNYYYYYFCQTAILNEGLLSSLTPDKTLKLLFLLSQSSIFISDGFLCTPDSLPFCIYPAVCFETS